jgi:dipeptidase E
LPELKVHFEHCKTILFIPLTRRESHDDTRRGGLCFKINKEVKGIHEYDDFQSR